LDVVGGSDEEHDVTEEEYTEAIAEFSRRLKYRFVNQELLIQALTHKSYANEHGLRGKDNQRLEFLGDAVLGLVMAEALMGRMEEASEGELTPGRAALVQEATLAEVARQIDLGSAIRLGRGEELNNGRDRASILADAVEALLGAVYLDSGYAASRDVVLALFGPKIEEVVDGEGPDDAKTELQQLLQARGLVYPQYRTVSEEGPDHAKVFEVEISVGDTVLAIGRGRSKKEAEKDAASRALDAAREEQ
jgi:ribonuclease-3